VRYVRMQVYSLVLPSFYLAEVKRHESIRRSLLIEIARVASDESGHVVAEGTAAVVEIYEIEVAVVRRQILSESLH